MNVHLTPERELLVQNKVRSGRYNSVSEVVRAALRLMEQRMNSVRSSCRSFEIQSIGDWQRRNVSKGCRRRGHAFARVGRKETVTAY